jgi:hypothetical protein
MVFEMDINERPANLFCPAPDLTGLFDKILNLEKKDSYPGLDNGQMNAFFHDKDSVLFNSKRLYQILQHDIQPLSKKEKQDLHRWMTRDVISGFATQVATYTLTQDEMLTNVKSVSGKYCKDGDIEPSRKKEEQLVTAGSGYNCTRCLPNITRPWKIIIFKTRLFNARKLVECPLCVELIFQVEGANPLIY